MYENGTLSFFGSPEGRVVNKGGVLEYQYSIADHQGNTRVVFSSVTPTPDAPVATLETSNQNAEQANFLKYDDVRKINERMFDRTNTGSTYYSVRLSGTSTETYGLARSLAVAPGDKVKAEVYAKYLDTNTSNWTTALTNLIGSITGGTATSGTVVDGGGYGTANGSTMPFAGMMSHSSETGTAPKAYLNWLVFDNKFKLITAKSGFRRLTEAARENGAFAPEGVAHEKLEMGEIEIAEPGYVYIYFSNENGTPVEVYFDDFQVTHTKTNIVQYNEYYPNGLQTANSWTREGSSNNFLYNEGTELNNNTGIYETMFRSYDPALGRFMQVDPLAAKTHSMSPYQYANNNPVFFNDPLGLVSKAPSMAQLKEIIDFLSNNGGGTWTASAYNESNGEGSCPGCTIFGENATFETGNNGTTLYVTSNTSTSSNYGNITGSGVVTVINIDRANNTADYAGWDIGEGTIDDTNGGGPDPFLTGGADSPNPLTDPVLALGWLVCKVTETAANMLHSAAKKDIGFGPQAVEGQAAKWIYGAFKSEAKWASQLSQRGWTAQQITEAIMDGTRFDAVNLVNQANSASRYVHPITGQSIVIDDVTKELLHVGGLGFKY